MVTSTSTPASMLMMICLTVSVGARRLNKSATIPRLNCPFRDLLDKTLVNAHLILVPGLGTLTARCLAGDDMQSLGRETDGTLDLQGLGAGTVHQLLAHLLEGGDLAGGEGDTDLVDLL